MRQLDSDLAGLGQDNEALGNKLRFTSGSPPRGAAAGMGSQQGGKHQNPALVKRTQIREKRNSDESRSQ